VSRFRPPLCVCVHTRTHARTHTHTHTRAYLPQVDVVQVVARAHRLHHPALGGVEVEREQGGLGHVQELGHGPRGQAAVGLEGHLGLQHVAVEAARHREFVKTKAVKLILIASASLQQMVQDGGGMFKKISREICLYVQ